MLFTRNLDTSNHIVLEPADDEVDEIEVAPIQSLVGDVSFAMGKMDVEGYELPALHGATEMLKRQNPPVWLLEVNQCSEAYAYGALELAGFLREYGYFPVRYRAKKGCVLPAEPDWQQEQNVLFVSEAHASDVQARLEEPDFE